MLPNFFSYVLAHMKIVTFMWHTVVTLIVAKTPAMSGPTGLSRGGGGAEVIKVLDAPAARSQTTTEKLCHNQVFKVYHFKITIQTDFQISPYHPPF